MKSIAVTNNSSVYRDNLLSLCQDDLSDFNSNKERNRKVTEDWLIRKIKTNNLQFKFFLTLSFFKGNQSIITQNLDNKHIKKVILDFFYPHKKPQDRIRLWMFQERHKESQNLHLHILMESIDGLTWLMKNNRKIILQKKTLFAMVADDYIMDDVIIESLTNHIKNYVRKSGHGKQSTKFKRIGDFSTRVHYVNKSIENLDFDGWDHIDFENSDL